MRTIEFGILQKILVGFLLFCLTVVFCSVYADNIPGMVSSIEKFPIAYPAFHSFSGEIQNFTRFSGTNDTYLYTYGDILLFSYVNGTQFEVYNSTLNLVWNGTIDEGGHQALSNADGITEGIYKIQGTNRYSVLIGDALTDSVMGYYAIDKDGKGLSNKIYTYQVRRYYDSVFAVFAYENSTEVDISNSVTGESIWSGILNESEHYSNTTLSSVYLTVTASKPVSALSYTDQGYFIPSSTGYFVGNKFYSYVGDTAGWKEDLNIIAYYDNTTVHVSDTETGDDIWNGSISAGECKSIPFSSEQYVTITSDKDVNAGVFPYYSYTSNYYFYIYAQDTSGTGIGRLFNFPALYNENMIIFSYSDNALVKVTNSSGSEIWSGSLNLGEYKKIPIRSKDVYKITGSDLISCVFYYGGSAGADFAPQHYIAKNITPIVTLTEPNGGEEWKIGSDQNITWVASGGSGSLYVDLYYSTTGKDGTYNTVVTGLSDSGLYKWNVPIPTTTNASVKIIVKDSIGRTANDTSDNVFTIYSGNLTPESDFIGTPRSGTTPLTVQFTDLSKNNPTSWEWDFGDSGYSSLKNPMHQYTAPGSYQVSLNATNSYGSNLKTVPNYINVTSWPVYIINATVGTGGKIEPSGLVQVRYGQNQTFVITADQCKGIGQVIIDGFFIPIVHPSPFNYTFYNVTGNHTISASFFQKDGGTINATAGAGGSISPAGYTNVSCGGNQTYAITPYPCYEIKDVIVDGVSIGSISTYTFTNVQTDHTISASFSQKISFITSTAGPGGSISPAGNTTVHCGSNQTYTITPETCYIISDVIVDGASAGPVTTYTFTNVQVDHTISVIFARKTFSITATAGAGGSIAPSGLIAVLCGNNQTFRINPDQNHKVSDVLVDGISKGYVASYTFANVQEDHTIEASFSRSEFIINSTSDQYTIVYPNGVKGYPEGSNKTYLTQAKPGSDLNDVVVDTESKGSIESWSFTNISSDHNISTLGAYTQGQVHVLFTMNKTWGQVPLTVQFTDQSAGNPTNYYWQFGDGGTSTLQNPVYTYMFAGTYSVTLRATNSLSGGVGVWNNAITVNDGPIPKPTPTPSPNKIRAAFSAAPVSGPAPLDVYFQDLSTGNPISWIWVFGDGTTSTIQNSTHRYNKPGTYSVTLLTQNKLYSGSLTKPGYIVVN